MKQHEVRVHRSDEEFEIGLETLLDRLEMALAQ